MKDGFFGLPAPLMTALAAVLGFTLLGKLDPAQQNSLGNFLMLIGQELETNSAQQQVLNSSARGLSLDDVKNELDELRRKIEGFSLPKKP